MTFSEALLQAMATRITAAMTLVTTWIICWLSFSADGFSKQISHVALVPWLGTLSPTVQLKEFVVVGRKVPTVHLPKPAIYKMTIYAPNTVDAKSRFWCAVHFLTLKPLPALNFMPDSPWVGQLKAVYSCY
jgi:hypothetical protein